MIMIENFNWKTLSFFIFRKKRGTWKKMSKKIKSHQIFIQFKNPCVGSKFTERSNFLCEENWIEQFFELI